MKLFSRIMAALLLLIAAAAVTQAQNSRKPSPPDPDIDTSWQNNPYVYWLIHHHSPNPPQPYPYPIPAGTPYTVVSNYYAPDVANAQPSTALLPPGPANLSILAVNLPTTAAVVWIDGNKMSSGLSATRVYTSPELEPGHDYYYKVKAQWVRRGDNVTQTRTVKVAAGTTTVVDFNKSE
jgi:uncharacterized protein (TIGR03000 family)